MQIRKGIYLMGLAGLICCCLPKLYAQESPVENDPGGHDKVAFKLTPSFYKSSDESHAADINLRGSLGSHTAWLGFYRDNGQFQQTRSGYEYRSDFSVLRTVLSAQVASGGFLGGSITAEIGDKNYAIVGWGRTNLKDYYNLNFDPNDAITLGVGSRAIEKFELSLFHIWDDRLHTQQHVSHALVRYKPNELNRWTVDLSQKRGLTGTGNFVRGYAGSVTYDFGNYFARVARDQYVNFSDVTQNRFSVGLRF